MLLELYFIITEVFCCWGVFFNVWFCSGSPIQIEYLLPNLGTFCVSIKLQLVYYPVTVANKQSTAEIKDNNPVSSYLFSQFVFLQLDCLQW